MPRTKTTVKSDEPSVTVVTQDTTPSTNEGHDFAEVLETNSKARLYKKIIKYCIIIVVAFGKLMLKSNIIFSKR